MEKYQVLATKSWKYLIVYLISLTLSILITVLTIVPFFISTISWFDYIGVILFSIFDLLIVYFLINYLCRPTTLLEIGDKSLKINKTKKKSIIISFDDLDSSKISISFFGVFVQSTGNIIIKTKDGKKYNIGYIENYIKVNGQINSIKYIKDMEG